MSDPGSVAAAYAIVLGGLVLYVTSIARRVQAARRTARMLEQQRLRDGAGAAPEAVPLAPRPSETSR